MLAERGCSSRSRPSCRRDRGAGAVAVAGCARRVPAALRGHPRHADQRRSCSARCSCRSGFTAGRPPRRLRGRRPSPSESRRATLGRLPLRAARHRAAAADSRPAAPAARPRGVAARQARADAPRAVPEALTWLEIHGHAPEVLEHWRGFIEAATVLAAERSAPTRTADAPPAATPPDGGRRRPCRRDARGVGEPGYPFFRSNSRMNSTSASTPSSGNAL